MSFILKTNPTVLNIKLTNAGRKALAEGRLNFAKWAVGDSEIDYAFNNTFIPPFDAFNANILRPKDANPDIVSFIKSNDVDESGTTIYTTLSSVASVTTVVQNPANERGFFQSISGSPYTFKNEPIIVKQPDAMVAISGVTGGKILNIVKAPTYIANITEPVIGDYILIKWANPDYTGSTVNFNVETVPTLWYKIEDMVTGTSLAANTLQVTVDRNLPDFDGQGGGIYSSVFIYPNSNNRVASGDSIQNFYGKPFITDFVTDSVLSFLENCNCSTIDVPVWNMSIVFREEIAGVKVTDRNYGQYFTKGFAGFVQYIQQIDDTIKKIGIIHYTNNSPSNQYGELLVEDTPVLELPTIMWHKKSNKKIGLTLTTDAASRDVLPDLNTVYHNLVDEDGNILGKVFNDLKVFVIEDQELLFAMSYKSNRNWTIPAPNIGFNVTLCPSCGLISGYTTSFSGTGGTTVTVNVIGDIIGMATYVASTDLSFSTGIYQSSPAFTGLAPDNYYFKIIDNGAPNCEYIITVPTIV
ncbi:MAG: hypothetical protein HC836_15600 [Richelia sp. RM2_1_2]|nr:hypothetical protein [Richelia sp. RM2_1_2]